MNRETARRLVEGIVKTNSTAGTVFVRVTETIKDEEIRGKDATTIRQEIIRRVNQRTGAQIKAPDLEANGQDYWRRTGTGRQNLRQLDRFVKLKTDQGKTRRPR